MAAPGGSPLHTRGGPGENSEITMSLSLATSHGRHSFDLLTCQCHYGFLSIPGGMEVPRTEALAMARWILAGGLFGLDEAKAVEAGFLTTLPSKKDRP